MLLPEQIMADQQAAMKAGEKETVSILRIINSAIKNEAIAKQRELSDDEVRQVAARQVKQLQDAGYDFARGGRPDLVEQNKREVAILQRYLPAPLSDIELAETVRSVVAEVRGSGQSDLGRVMGLVMKRVQGRVDGNRVRELVTRLLSSEG